MEPLTIGVLALLACCLLALLVRRRHIFRDVTLEAERIVPTPGRFRAMELNILGVPPEIPKGLWGELTKEKQATIREKPPSTTLDAVQMPSDVPLHVAAPLDGLLGDDYAWAWASVDDHLFQAVEQMTHHSVHSVADLSHAIRESSWTISPWRGADAGLVTSIKGHVAEWLAKDHLGQAGIPVEMATTSNLPGIDLWVAGHPVNVKVWRDAAQALRDHFDRYPDVAALLNVDAANIPPDALHFDPSQGLDLQSLHHAQHLVLVDDALSNADVTAATQSGLDVAAGHTHLYFHIPWITMAISGIRETRLLWKGYTDVQRAAKNVLVDTVSVGGAGAIGAKTGGVIGSAIAPGVGTLIGATLGGVTGAILGRLAGNAVKQKPLKEAQGLYEAALTDFRAVQERTKAQAEQEWRTFNTEQQVWLTSQREAAEGEAREALAKAKANLEKAQTIPAEAAVKLLAQTNQELAARVKAAHRRYVEFPWWRRWIWPSVDSLTARHLWRSFRSDVKRWEMQRQRVRAAIARGKVSTHAVFDLAVVAAGGESSAKGFLVKVGLERARAVASAEQAQGVALSRVLKARATVVEKLRAKQNEIVQWLRDQLDPHVKRLMKGQENLISELRKAGVGVATHDENLRE